MNGRDEDYLLDLTKPYHNLLRINGEGNEQSFYFDWNVTAMEEKRKGGNGSGRRAFAGLHYYMQDELGSPLRVSGFGSAAGVLSDWSSYLSYGYDEFGNDLGRKLEGVGIPNPYDRPGGEQPLGYTGYRYDEIDGAYFAQAREYQPENGRFVSEDVINGISIVPNTLNYYSYCWNNSLIFIDRNGKEPEREKTYTLEVTSEINGIGLMWDESGTEGTILFGMDATVDDAYAIITLDNMKDRGCSEDEINKFINEYRDKKGDDTLIAAGKTVDYYTNFEDITGKLTMKMLKNEYEYWDDIALVSWTARLDQFYENVKNKGAWDLKQLPEWGNSSLYVFNGEIVDRDAPGNIMYGYMGHAYGIPDAVLCLGAAYAQLQAETTRIEWLAFPYPPGTWGDDPMDQLNIERGIAFYKKIHFESEDIEGKACCE